MLAHFSQLVDSNCQLIQTIGQYHLHGEQLLVLLPK